MNPRFLAPTLTATPSVLSQYAYLRKGTRQKLAPSAHRLFLCFTRQLDDVRLRH